MMSYKPVYWNKSNGMRLANKNNLETKLADLGFENINDNLYKRGKYVIRKTSVNNIRNLLTIWHGDERLFIAKNQEDLLEKIKTIIEETR